MSVKTSHLFTKSCLLTLKFYLPPFRYYSSLSVIMNFCTQSRCLFLESSSPTPHNILVWYFYRLENTILVKQLSYLEYGRRAGGHSRVCGEQLSVLKHNLHSSISLEKQIEMSQCLLLFIFVYTINDIFKPNADLYTKRIIRPLQYEYFNRKLIVGN